MVGVESVWDYPRPPRLERCGERVRVVFAGRSIADSTTAFRVLEILVPTTHPPWCEWKGQAQYWMLRVGSEESPRAAWSYADPTRSFAEIRDHLAFYPARVDACYVGEEQVVRQAGDFYGGWITSNIRGPFKGGPGSLGW